MTDRTETSRNSNAKSRAADNTKRMERPPIEAWSPANVLETPPNTGEYRYRWIAEHVNGLHTPRNVQMALREKYQRVSISELPEDFLVDEDTKGDGYARTGGLILMKVPEHFAQQRQKYYADKSKSAVGGANELQGLARGDAIAEDRGTRSLDGAEAGRALANMSQA